MNTSGLYKKALFLSLFTIGYNLVEGILSVTFGLEDETLSLAGFGIDSFIEVVSGLGIMQMVLRIRKNPGSDIGRFEITALKITGLGFYILTAGLAAGIVFSIIRHHRPETTIWGIIIAVSSIIVMTWLASSKIKTGKKLGSDAILADSKCTMVCIYMSIVLLIASLIYQFTGFMFADSIGAAGLAWFSLREGHEALEKAKERRYACCD